MYKMHEVAEILFQTLIATFWTPLRKIFPSSWRERILGIMRCKPTTQRATCKEPQLSIFNFWGKWQADRDLLKEKWRSDKSTTDEIFRIL